VYAAGDVYYATAYAGVGIDGNPPLSVVNAANRSDALIVKLDASGMQQWLRVVGSAENDINHGIVVDDTGALYVTGATGGALAGQTPAGLNDAFLVKQCGR